MSPAGATVARRPRSTGRAVRDSLRVSRRLRRRLLAAVLAVAVLLGAYLLWLRDSSLVKVDTVTVTGMTSDDSPRVRAALTAAARQMTTLHVDRERLEAATAAFPAVRSIEVHPDFPNGMRIHVIEHRPAALAVAGSKRVPVAADGSVLSGVPVRRKLAVVRVDGPLPARRLTARDTLPAVRVAGGIPPALADRVEEVRRSGGGKGVMVPIADGPQIFFGDATRLAAKWAAAVRVLADADAAGADYIDVRIPERPVAGGLPVATVAPVAPAPESPSVAPPAASENASPARAQDEAPPPAAPAGSPIEAPAAAPRPTAPPPAPQPQVGEGGGASPNPQG